VGGWERAYLDLPGLSSSATAAALACSAWWMAAPCASALLMACSTRLMRSNRSSMPFLPLQATTAASAARGQRPVERTSGGLAASSPAQRTCRLPRGLQLLSLYRPVDLGKELWVALSDVSAGAACIAKPLTSRPGLRARCGAAAGAGLAVRLSLRTSTPSRPSLALRAFRSIAQRASEAGESW
jgi:hypothetical protein